jgi:hypothetical protein
MSTEEHIAQLTAQVTALQAQLAQPSRSPPPQPTATATPPPKPPKVAPPTPFSGAQDDLDRFKAECSLYLNMRHAEFPDERSSVLFVLSYMKGGSAGPWATQQINAILGGATPTDPTWAEFTADLDEMFADPNRHATARRKLATLRQGEGPVEDLVRQFEIHGPVSGLGDVGIVDRFEQAIHPRLRESIYRLEPMPTTWAEWKRKASLLDNQWRRFRETQPKVSVPRTFALRAPAPHTPTTSAASSSVPPPSAHTASSGPQPMDLDRAHPLKRDPRHGLCFNCGKPRHIAKVCRGPRNQKIRNVDPTTTPRLAPEDLQALVDSVRAAMVSSAPTTPPADPEDEKTQEEKGF